MKKVVSNFQTNFLDVSPEFQEFLVTRNFWLNTLVSDVTRTSRDGVITCIYPTVTGTEEQLTFQLSCELPKVVENASFDRRRILVFECQLFVFFKKIVLQRRTLPKRKRGERAQTMNNYEI